jgi:hypothetical protein
MQEAAVGTSGSQSPTATLCLRGVGRQPAADFQQAGADQPD